MDCRLQLGYKLSFVASSRTLVILLVLLNKFVVFISFLFIMALAAIFSNASVCDMFHGMMHFLWSTLTVDLVVLFGQCSAENGHCMYACPNIRQ